MRSDRVIASVVALGNRSTVNFDGIGRVVSTQDARGNLSTSVFDAIDRAIAQISPLRVLDLLPI